MAKLMSDTPYSSGDRDELERINLVKRLSEIIVSADTPITLGVFGEWGSGKTSLMKMTQEYLEREHQINTVWFNTWQHQHSDHIIIPLLQTIRAVSDSWGIKGNTLKFLTILGTTIGDVVLRSVTVGSVSADSIISLGEKYEKQYFEAKSVFLKIQDNFAEAVKEVVGEDGRLVIFIDDLDRCLPEKSLEILEGLKIYLSVPQVVFVLGADAAVLNRAVKSRYKDSESINDIRNYLDKLIQMSFEIPKMSETIATRYCQILVSQLVIGDESLLQGYIPIIVKSLDKNPRKIKKLFNSLAFIWDLIPYYDYKFDKNDERLVIKILTYKLGGLPLGLDDPGKFIYLETAVFEENTPEIMKLVSRDTDRMIELMKMEPQQSNLDKVKMIWEQLALIHL